MRLYEYLALKLGNRGSVAGLIVMATCIVLVAATTWWWQANLPSTESRTERGLWREAKKRYPTPASVEFVSLSPEMLQGIITGNPFSPDRGRVTPQGGSSENVTQQIPKPVEPKEPVFIYKGSVKLGARLRAIVEDVEIGKTHFLEVGQEVAGYKVLDIAENRVVLSHPKTQENIEVTREDAQ